MRVFIYLVIFVSLMFSGYFLNRGNNDNTVLKIGVTAGIHEDIMNFILPKLQEQGINAKISVFNDFILPNRALHEGDLDINSYQHKPYLDDQIKSLNYNITAIDTNILVPMSIYSLQTKNTDSLAKEAIIAIPSDPTNRGRALLILESAKIIKIKKEIKDPLLPEKKDILNNENNNIRIVEIDAPLLPNILKDVNAAVINTDWVKVSNVINTSDAIYTESTKSPYVNILVANKNSLEKKI